MMNSILGNGPYINEAMAVAESTMTCLMGREAAYSGQKVTWDMMMNSQLDLLPKLSTTRLRCRFLRSQSRASTNSRKAPTPSDSEAVKKSGSTRGWQTEASAPH